MPEDQRNDVKKEQVLMSILKKLFYITTLAAVFSGLIGCAFPSANGVSVDTKGTTTVGVNTDSSAATLILEGISALESHQYTTARAKFTAALAVEPGNDQAKLWKGMLDLAASTVDANIVSLMQDNFGVIGYPTTMEALFSDTWFSEQWYQAKSGFVLKNVNDIEHNAYIRGNLDTSSSAISYSYYDFSTGKVVGSTTLIFVPSDSGAYCRYYDDTEIPSGYTQYELVHNIVDTTKPLAYLIPEMKVPTWIPEFGQVSSHSLANLPLLFLANVLDGNPTGFNQIVDRVLSGCFGNDFNSMVASVRGINQSARVVIPASLIADYAGSAPGFEVTIGKAELLALASQLELIKSLVQYVASYKLSYPLSAGQFDWYAMLNGTILDTNHNTMPDFMDSIITSGTVPGIFVSDLLKVRSMATRMASKDTMAAGLGDLGNAANLISTGLLSGDYDDYLSESDAHELATQIDTYVHYVGEFQDAVETGAPLIVNEQGSQLVFYAESLFNSAALSLRNNIEYDRTTDKPVIYKIYRLSDSSEKIQLASLAKPSNSTWKGIALQVNFSGLNTIYPALGTAFNYHTGALGGNIYLRMYTGNAEWDTSGYVERLASWLTGF